VANRSKGGRRRSRKRHATGRASVAVAANASERVAANATPTTSTKATPSSEAVRTSARRAERDQATPKRAKREYRAPGSVGERPEAPWHPFPLSELLILIGAIATVIGLTKLKHGISSGGTTLIVAVLAVLVGTVEFTLREHRSGYRSHTTLLAAIPAVVVYTGSLLVIAAFDSPIPAGLKVAPLALALPVFALLFKLLRARFADARRERVLAGRRAR
jgi:hypothetical protein